jgi:microsomal dipeptidase-like Zn-dependent dipeptidase
MPFYPADHINHVKNLIGAEHVGIGSDYDGVSRVPEGLEDVSKYPVLFDLLAEEGHGWTPWTQDELKNLAGLNLIRVFKQVEAVRDSMKSFDIYDDPIPYADILAANPDVSECRTDIEKYRPVFKGSDVLNEVPLIDGHNDLPWNLYNRENNQLKNFDFDSNLKENPRWKISSSMTDLPRLRLGKLRGQFWVAYVSCTNNYKDALERTMEQIDVIKRLVDKYSNDLMYVTEADQIMEAFKQNKIASMIEIEGPHSLDSRLSALRLYYEMGVRCMTITHSCNVPW